jgi:hypothetical protein
MDAALAELLKQGLLGVILVLVILGFVAVSKLLLAEKDKRIDDAAKTRDNIAEPLRQMNESLARMEAKIIVSKKVEQNETQ